MLRKVLYIMHRTQLLLDDWQYEVLKTLSEKEGRSISYLVREAVASYITKDQRKVKKKLRQLEGLGEDTEAAGRDHDKFLYGVKSRRSR